MPRRIVLVIGAGASKDLNRGFQLGDELLRDIRDRVTDATSPGAPYLSALLLKLGFEPSLRDRFVSHLKAYYQEATSPSIDGFLDEVNSYPEVKDDREQFIQIGKFAIVFHILGSEGQLRNEGLSTPSWIEVLSRFVRQNVLTSSQRTSRYDLRIATFNYDRNIEHWLYESASTPQERDRMREFIQKSVAHIYGRVGHLPWESAEDHFIYGEDNDKAQKIFDNKNAIDLMYSERGRNTTATGWIHDPTTDYVCTFGFGFDLVNYRLLGLQDLNLSNSERKLVANVFPSTSGGYGTRRSLAHTIRTVKHDAEITYLSCADFLNYVFERLDAPQTR